MAYDMGDVFAGDDDELAAPAHGGDAALAALAREGAAAQAAVRRDVVRPTDLHVLCGPVVDGVRTGAPSPFPRSCGAIVWLEEGVACCKGGKNILGEAFNPPIDAEYLALLQMPYMSEDSRHLNAMLAMATQ